MHPFPSTRTLIAAALAWLALTVPAAAQSMLGGVVRDPTGQVAPNVTVIAENEATNETWETRSNNLGLYAFYRLPNGSYTAAGLARRGHSAHRIAKLLDARPEAVKEAIGQARQLLEYFAPEIAMNWIDASRIAAGRGDHRPAMALLQSIKVVEPSAQTYDIGNRPGAASAAVHVQFVGFTFAGLPVPPQAETCCLQGADPADVQIAPPKNSRGAR